MQGSGGNSRGHRLQLLQGSGAIDSRGHHLQLLQRDLLLAVVVSDEEAVGLHAAAVVLHVEGDRAPCFCPPTHVVELEPHKSFHQGCKKVQKCTTRLQPEVQVLLCALRCMATTTTTTHRFQDGLSWKAGGTESQAFLVGRRVVLRSTQYSIGFARTPGLWMSLFGPAALWTFNSGRDTSMAVTLVIRWSIWSRRGEMPDMQDLAVFANTRVPT
jgi:hypothetical protein